MKKQNQKGITLIALIITIIVMLILVGVTINVALNGGLFQKAETATYQTEASLVKEQLEIAKAIELANAEGKKIEDYSYIKVENLEGLDQQTKTKFKDIILVNSNGDICYNTENVSAEEITMLEAIGIKAYVNNPGGGNNEPGGNEPTGTDYSFTLKELGEWIPQESEGWIIFEASNVWHKIGKDLSEDSDYFELKEVFAWGVLETDNTIFSSLTLELLGQGKINEDTQILIAPFLLEVEGIEYFVITAGLPENPNAGYIGKEMSAEDFMNDYGNVEFRLVELPK